jgi:hypothetical protein
MEDRYEGTIMIHEVMQGTLAKLKTQNFLKCSEVVHPLESKAHGKCFKGDRKEKKESSVITHKRIQSKNYVIILKQGL